MTPLSSNYSELHHYLKQNVSLDSQTIELKDDLDIVNCDFVSDYRRQSSSNFVSPGIPAELIRSLPSEIDLSSLFATPDDDVTENRRFRYHLMHPKSVRKTKKLIILLHGFNERSWDKYLPWAAHLTAKTGKSVLMFPISFLMNRSPKLWVDARAMRKVSQWRKSQHPDVVNSTLSNAAISERIHQNPSRFLWSGLETHQNVVELVKFIRQGLHEHIDEQAGIDFFTYSIGTFLGEIIMMTNPQGLFSDTKFAVFCGGAVFDRLSPVSKFILDSEANARLFSFFVDRLDSHRRNDPYLDEFLETQSVGKNFHSFLNYRLELQYRENRLKELAGQFFAVTMAKDEVVPPLEIVNTLQGSAGDIDIPVTIFEPTYSYRHEDPFPIASKHIDEVNETFDRIFNLLGDFLT
ncbi:MAG: DUF6051 family protein [Deltaproteobacteria bacterium]|jgi:hypothetical protein|nr:DUF6051 family protein [Deltaproteobacteria bacterium]